MARRALGLHVLERNPQLNLENLGAINWKKLFIKNKRGLENISGKKFMMYSELPF